MDERLKQAYHLLKQGDRQAALNLIKQVLHEDRDCADAWFLLGTAQRDRERKLAAINNALRIDPQHRAALRLKQRLTGAEESPAPPPQPASPPPRDPVIVPLDGSPANAPPRDTDSGFAESRRSVVNSSAGDPWHHVWNNTTTTILGLFVLIAAMSFPFIRYVRTGEQNAGLMVLFLAICFVIAAGRWVMGRNLDARAIPVITIFTGVVWVLLIADLSSINPDPDAPRQVVLVAILIYSGIALGWVTGWIPFGPHLKQALMNKFEPFVDLKGHIELGETRRDTLCIRRPLKTHVYYYQGQAGDEIHPTVEQDGNSPSEALLRPYVYAWITVVGLWGKLHRISHLTLEGGRLPYTGTYVIAVSPYWPEADREDDLDLGETGDYDYRLEMRGVRHGADAATSRSSIAFAIQAIMEERANKAVDPASRLEEARPSDIIEKILDRD